MQEIWNFIKEIQDLRGEMIDISHTANHHTCAKVTILLDPGFFLTTSFIDFVLQQATLKSGVKE
jgi:hypothetical protein